MKKEQIVLLLGLMVGFYCRADNNNGSDVKIVVEGGEELPEWIKTLVSAPLPKHEKYLFAYALPNLLRVYEVKNGAYNLVLREILGSTAHVIGFNRRGTLLAVIDRAKKQLVLYGKKRGPRWEELSSIHEGLPSSGGLWTAANRLATFLKGIMTIYDVSPSGRLTKVYEQTVPHNFSFAIGETSVKQKDVARKARKLPWYSRLRAYIRQVTGY